MLNRILIFVFLCSIVFACGCQSTHPIRPIFSGYESPYPKESAVAISPQLELGAIRSLKKMLKNYYGEDSFEIVSRRPAGELTQLIIDCNGRLWKGEIHEIWTIDVFGMHVEYEFFMRADGEGKSSSEFRKYEKN